jgi:hypothetical protein
MRNVVRMCTAAAALAGVALLWIPTWSDGETEYEGEFPCTGWPDPPRQPSPCNPQVDSCTPLNPPPTAWNPSCCKSGYGGACIQVWWRPQCCHLGKFYWWGYAWKKDPPDHSRTCVNNECV